VGLILTRAAQNPTSSPLYFTIFPAFVSKRWEPGRQNPAASQLRDARDLCTQPSKCDTRISSV